MPLRDYVTEDFGPSQFMQQLCAIVSLTVLLLNFAVYGVNLTSWSQLNVFIVAFWSFQQLLALFGILISVGNFFEVSFSFTQKLYVLCEQSFWFMFWILIATLFFGLLGLQIADENGIRQISAYVTQTVSAQLLQMCVLFLLISRRFADVLKSHNSDTPSQTKKDQELILVLV